MKQMHRNLIIVILILISAAAGFIYFSKEKVSFKREASMYKAVPLSVPVFIEVQGLKSLPLGNDDLPDFFENSKDFMLLKQLAELDSTVRYNEQLKNSLRNENFLVAFDFVGEQQIFPLIVLKAENSGKQKAIKNLLAVLYPEQNKKQSEREYSNHKIISMTNGKSQTINFSFSKGLFLASPKSLLLETSLRQLELESISENPYFSKVNRSVTSQSKIAWYVNHKTFPELVKLWLNDKTQTSVNEFGETVRKNPRNEFNRFIDFASWSELDFAIDNEIVRLNGITVADDSLNQYLSVFDGQQPIRSRMDEFLPKNTSFFTGFSLSDKNLFFENLERYFTHSGEYYKREDKIKKMESGFQTGLRETLKEFVKSEVILATTSIPAETEKRITLFLLQTEGKSNVEPLFLNLLDAYSSRMKIGMDKLKSVYNLDSETEFDIYQFPYPSLPEIWLGSPFGMAQARYAAFYGNYLVFCNTEKGLKDYLYNMVLESTLNKDIRYSRFKENMVNRSTIISFLNVNRFFEFHSRIFDADASKSILEREEFWRNIYALNWQIVSEKDIFYNALHIDYGMQQGDDAKTTWQSSIGNGIISGPQLMVNHNEKGAMDILMQDDNNKLHQVTKEGRLRWSIPVSERILSRFHQVDYFKNGKLQYLFNTKNKLYLIDRDGNNVAHFPIELRSQATNGINVFDYDNNRNYRYFIAGEDRRIYVYDRDGNTVRGWSFGKTDFVVRTPIHHYRVNNKDYIVFKDKNHIYIQNRKGEDRVITKAKFENSDNPLVLSTEGKPKIVATDNTGKVYYLYFDGNFEEKKTGRFGAGHLFTNGDLNGDGISEFIFAEGRELKVLNENGKKLFERKFRNEITRLPRLYAFPGGRKKIGIVESSSNRIHLIDSSGESQEGFPLQGNSDFIIGKLSKENSFLSLIVGSDGGYLYHYAL